MTKKKDPVWFKNPAQVHKYIICEIGEEFIYGDKQVAVKEKGVVYTVAQKTIYNHIDAALLKSRRGVGGFAKRTVDQYATRELGEKIVSGTKGELPEPSEAEGENENARARRTMADAEVKEVDAALRRLKLKKSSVKLFRCISSVASSVKGNKLGSSTCLLSCVR